MTKKKATLTGDGWREDSRIVVVMPAFDPGPAVVETVRSTVSLVDKLVLIDDGCCSEDVARLEQCVQDFGAILLRHEANKGKGFALETGLQYAINSLSADYIVTMDSDGQHAPADVEGFIEAARGIPSTEMVMVMGKRELSQMPLRSEVGNTFTSLLFRFLFLFPVTDTQTGFRMLSRALASALLDVLEPGGYEFEMQMLVYAATRRCVVREVTIQTIYENNNEISKFRPIQDSLHVLTTLWRYVRLGLLSFILDLCLFCVLQIIGVPLLSSHVGARLVSGPLNHLANRRIAERRGGRKWPPVRRYLASSVISLSITGLVLWALSGRGSMPPLAGKIIGELCAFALSFFLIRGRIRVTQR